MSLSFPGKIPIRSMFITILSTGPPMTGQSSDFCGQGLIVYQVTHMRQGRGKDCLLKFLKNGNDTDRVL